MKKISKIYSILYCDMGIPGGSEVKNLPVVQETQRHRFNPWVRKIPWRRKWQPTPVILPGKSYGQRSLMAFIFKWLKTLKGKRNTSRYMKLHKIQLSMPINKMSLEHSYIQSCIVYGCLHATRACKELSSWQQTHYNHKA